MINLKRGISASALMIALYACSDNEIEIPEPETEISVPDSTGTSAAVNSGSVTGFGSIVVNGVRIATNANTVYAVEGEDEVVGDDSAISLGQIVVAISSRDEDGTLVGSRFEAADGILGLVSSVAPDANNPEIGEITIAGQRIIIDDNTIFDDDLQNLDANAGVDIRDLAPALSPNGAGLVVEISGYATQFGAIASRVELQDDLDADSLGTPGIDDDDVQVVGFVDSVDPAGGFIVINGATFAVDGATDIDDGLVIDETLVGAFVEVEADIDGSGAFVAVEIENESDFNNEVLEALAEGDEFDVEGVLQSVDTSVQPNIIVVNGLTVPVEDAGGLVDLVGQIIEVEGEFSGDDIVMISETDVELENSVEIEDIVTSVDTAGGVFTTRLGLVIEPTGASRLELDSDLVDDDTLNPDEFIGALSVGDLVEARGIPLVDDIVWTRIEVESVDDDDNFPCSLEGPVDDGSIADPLFSILEVAIDTAGLNEQAFVGDDGESIGRGAFFEILEGGQIVRAQSDNTGEGCLTGNLVTTLVGEVSLQDGDSIAGNSSADDDEDDESEADGVVLLALEGTPTDVDPAARVT